MAMSDPQTPTEFQMWTLTSLTCWIKKEALQFAHIFHIIAASYNRIYMFKYPIKLVFTSEIKSLGLSAIFI